MLSNPHHYSKCHVQAETQALLWAVKLAKCEGWPHVMFEGDAKGIFDPLSFGKASPDWSINVISSDILEFAVFFDSFSFVWVKRSCNVLAHATAKFALKSLSSFFFNKDNLPPGSFCHMQG